MSASKEGTASETSIAIRQNQAASLVVRDGFVYWATSYTIGSVARCPITGCAGGNPEILADHQYFPHFIDLDGDVLFWMNGATAPVTAATGGTPIQILSCELSNCAATIEVLDEGTGKATSGPWRMSREMVVDSEAIYWIGDVVSASSSDSQRIAVDASIRRTVRRPRR